MKHLLDFWKPGETRKDLLSKVGAAIQSTTCRCSKVPGWTYNGDRNMWVCSGCAKPSGWHGLYNPTCIWCGEEFTLYVFVATVHSEDAAACTMCGGENQVDRFNNPLEPFTRPDHIHLHTVGYECTDETCRWNKKTAKAG